MRERFEVGLWKAIRGEWDVMGSNMASIVGNGRRVRFWNDMWCDDATLCIFFPSLFTISLFKEAWLEDVWNHFGGGVWGPRFSRWLDD